MFRKSFPGINIQFPISQSILSGTKTVETRTYALPKKYLNRDLVLIETPGPHGGFRARITAIIKFTECIEYKSKTAFYRDTNRHLVTPHSKWAWTDKPKFGWKVDVVKVISPAVEFYGQKGIVFTTEVRI
jgi:hypothetical protein